MTTPNSLAETIAALRGLLDRVPLKAWSLYIDPEAETQRYQVIVDQDGYSIGDTLNSDERPEDAAASFALIVAAINALPDLLNALEAREGEPASTIEDEAELVDFIQFYLRETRPSARAVKRDARTVAHALIASHAIRWAPR